jgi:hypothetical protein
MSALAAAIGMAQQTTPGMPIPITPPTPTFQFGMTGLASGQTARLNVVNQVRTPPPLGIALVACKVELDLYDAQGKLIKTKTVANLAFGQADFLDLGRAEAGTGVNRVEITGVVKVSSNQSFFCNITPTLEVFDDLTGHTTAILANPAASYPVVRVGSFTPAPLAP